MHHFVRREEQSMHVHAIHGTTLSLLLWPICDILYPEPAIDMVRQAKNQTATRIVSTILVRRQVKVQVDSQGAPALQTSHVLHQSIEQPTDRGM